jgi:competence protein ComEC
VVTLALTPLGLLLFGQVSVVGLVANLLAIPWVTLVVTPLALLGVLLLAPLWDAAALAVQAAGGGAAVDGWPAAVGHRVGGRAPLWAGAAGCWAGWCWRCAGPGACARWGCRCCCRCCCGSAAPGARAV